MEYIRHYLFGQAKKGTTAPAVEASRLFNVLGVDEVTGRDSHAHVTLDATSRERPADVLRCRAHEIHFGAAGSGIGWVALDVGIVCLQAESHRSKAAKENN